MPAKSSRVNSNGSCDRIDLADPALHASGSGMDVLRHLQDEHPVFWNAHPGGGGFWVLTRYEDAVNVLRNQRVFTTAQGIQVGQAGQENLPASGKMMVMSEKGSHRRIKAIMSRQLLPSMLERLVPALRKVAFSAVNSQVGRDSFDFVSEIAGEMTIAALGDLIGIPHEDREVVSEWTCIAFGARTSNHPELPLELESVEANAQLFAYFYDLLEERRRNPSAGLLGALAAPSDGGTEKLDDQEILFNVHLLLAGGHETTRQALTGAAVAFVDHPAQWSRLRSDWSLVPTAIEEILRWSAPSLNVMRTATEDTVVRDQPIKAGQHVTMWNPILNRDRDVFPNADEFDVARDPNRHLSFGAGSHFCLGSWLAKVELQILLEELRPAVTRLERAGSARRLHSNRTWGYDEFVVRLIA